jgi:hypothetical protein
MPYWHELGSGHCDVVRSYVLVITVINASEDRIQDAEDVANTVKQIEEERNVLASSRKLLEELLGRVREEAVFKAASEMQTNSTHITGNLERGFQIGTNNATISDKCRGADARCHHACLRPCHVHDDRTKGEWHMWTFASNTIVISRQI